MSIILLVILFSLAMLGLLVSANVAVNYIKKAALLLGLTNFMIATVVLSFFTTLPEFSSTLVSQIENLGDVGIGIIIGTILFNTAIILGGTMCIYGKFKTDKFERGSYYILLLAGAVVTLLSLDGVLSRLDGLIFLGIFSGHLYRLAKRVKKKINHRKRDHKFYIAIAGMIIAILALVGSAIGTVKFGKDLAIAVGMPMGILGLILIGIGTSLPEFTAGFTSAIKRQEGIAVGNIIGANVVDLLLIFGVASLIKPIVFNIHYFFMSYMLMMVMLAGLAIYVAWRKVIDRPISVFMIVIYAIFIWTLI